MFSVLSFILTIDFLNLFFTISIYKKIIIQYLVMYEHVQKVVFNPNSIHVHDPD